MVLLYIWVILGECQFSEPQFTYSLVALTVKDLPAVQEIWV